MIGIELFVAAVFLTTGAVRAWRVPCDRGEAVIDAAIGLGTAGFGVAGLTSGLIAAVLAGAGALAFATGLALLLGRRLRPPRTVWARFYSDVESTRNKREEPAES